MTVVVVMLVNVFSCWFVHTGQEQTQTHTQRERESEKKECVCVSKCSNKKNVMVMNCALLTPVPLSETTVLRSFIATIFVVVVVVVVVDGDDSVYVDQSLL